MWPTEKVTISSSLSQKPSCSRNPPNAATMSRATLGFSVMTSDLLNVAPDPAEWSDLAPLWRGGKSRGHHRGSAGPT